jgi:ATP-dependent helicase/nuclease subunit B
VSAAGDPLRPSRLLLRCAEAELPGRVAALFRPAETARPAPSWRRAWRLQPPVVPPPVRVSVTAFRDYLRCPFRFYLKHALKMETVDPFKSELDALDFGTLCHAALEAMGREPALRDRTDAAGLREFLLAHVDRRARDLYGTELTLPLLVQLESARQRLARAAEVQAEQRAAGWVIEHIERKFELALGAVTVSAKIDRIERHAATGAVRVIDYKTSDKGVSPLAAHVRSARRGETAPAWARFTRGDKELVWTDLQLPLYLEAVAGEFGGAAGAGYFNLPKAVGETSLVLWEDYDAEWRAAARRCAEGVAAAVTAGVFWPPAEMAPRDEAEAFAGLFHHGTADSVAWEGAS